MNAPIIPAYAAANSPVRDSRSAEAAVLSRITGQLARAAQSQSSFPQLAAALEDNRRFWNQAASDLASDGNRLPQQVRVSLLGLATFITQHTAKILAGAASADPLVAINSAVVRGLSGEAA